VRLAFCGLAPPLSLTVSAADALPLACGLNVTLNEQLLCAESVLPQVVVSLKDVGFVPVIEMPVIETEVPPLLLRVTVCGALLVPTA
jgi:hypothetical protein